jgi:ATP-dependent Clp protease protease subunit
MATNVIAPLFDYEARIISVLGDLGVPEANLIVDQLLRLDAESNAPITVFVSSRGGTMVDGLKITDALGLLRSPVTSVGLGLIEGAGFLLLVMADERIIFPSTLISTAGLWDLPHLHSDAKRSMGINAGADAEEQLHKQIKRRVEDVIISSNGKLPAFLADYSLAPQILNARACLDHGIADAIVEGSQRLLTKPQNKINKYVAKSIVSPEL